MREMIDFIKVTVSLKTLQKLEWIRDEFTGYTGGKCHICGGYRTPIGLKPGEFAGHTDRCELGQAIKRGTVEYDNMMTQLRNQSEK